MFKNLFLICLIIVCVFIYKFINVENNNALKNISIHQFVRHPALDRVTQGIKNTLQKSKMNAKISLKNANGNIPMAVQIANYQSSQKPDVIVAVATPAAQASQKLRDPKNTLLCFAAVTDPIAAGLDLENNICGVTDEPPLTELVDIITKTMPQRKRIGVIFNPGEINSVKSIDKLQLIANTYGLQVVVFPVDTTSNIKIASQQLSGKVDIIYLPLDNLVVSALDVLTKFALEQKIPIVGNDSELLNRGLLLTLGGDYFEMGEQLGNMIIDILSGKKLEKIGKKYTNIVCAKIKN
ncbi:MAG: ABC transporter substrate-binding protein [Legionellales bacterium]|nr:ABC transporter substrate-binding protein [Legionellales bacterium]